MSLIFTETKQYGKPMCNILVNIQIDSAFVHSGRVVLFLREKCFLKAQFIIWAFHTWCLTKGLSVVFRHNFFICLQNKRVRMIFNFRPLTVSFSLWVTQFYLEFVRFFFSQLCMVMECYWRASEAFYIMRFLSFKDQSWKSVLFLGKFVGNLMSILGNSLRAEIGYCCCAV